MNTFQPHKVEPKPLAASEKTSAASIEPINDTIYYRIVVALYFFFFWFNAVVIQRGEDAYMFECAGRVIEGHFSIPGIPYHLKFGPRVRLGEAHLTRYASILLVQRAKVPKIYCAFKFKKNGYILMEKIKGDTLEVAWESLTPKKRQGVICQLQAAVECLRKDRQISTSGLYQTPLAHPVLPNRKSTSPFGDRHLRGPFDSVDESNRHLINLNHERAKTEDEQFRKDFLKGDWLDKDAIFTHGDLSPYNILIDKNGLISIIDWETAGWWPSYIEYYMADRYTLDYWLHNEISVKDWIPYEKNEIFMIEQLLYLYYFT